MFGKAVLLSLALPAYAAVHESLAGLPAGWSDSGHVISDDAPMKLQVALQYKNLDQLESKLLSVSTPGSSEYGKYLEKEDVEALFHPSDDAVSKVKSWIAGAGATDIEYEAGVLNFKTTVGAANKLLDTKYGLYTNGKTTKLRTTAYSVPDHLTELVDLVSPTIYFGTTEAHAAIPMPEGIDVAKRQLENSCFKKIEFQNETFEVIGPDCLKELYNVGDYSADKNSGSDIAFGNFLNESASYSDLEKFQKIYNLPSQNFSILAEIDGGVNDQNPLTEMDGEANLDVQNIMGLIDGLPVGAYITGGLPPFIPDLLQPNASLNQNEPYLPYYQYLLSQPNSKLPHVITNSYGDIENTVPYSYAKRVCNMIGMMGMRGRTIFESSGDLGVGAVCLTDQGPRKRQFDPVFPATCPYLTAVGGTQSYNPEIGWNGSSGGFSNYFSQPSYQKTAISTYINDYLPASVYDYYNSNEFVNFTGRGFPDVAAHSLWPFYLTVINGTAQINGGTSAASPVTAAIFALLNDALFRAGRPAIGFANPWLYAHAAPSGAINDITAGESRGCHERNLQSGEIIKGAGVIRWASWNGTKGWDPITGLGTPNFQKLKSLATESS